MRTMVWAAVALLALAAPVDAAEPVSQTFAVPVERAWTTTLAVLRHLGWSIDKEDRAIGWITTESRRVAGEDYGVYEKGTRHRLRVNIRAAGEGSTAITVERSLFKRERILWMDNDEPLTTQDQTVEKAVLSAIGKSF